MDGNNDNDDEEEYDENGEYANEQAHEIVDDLEKVDRAKRGDQEAQQELANKYPHIRDLDELEETLESDFYKEKKIRDQENKLKGRAVSESPDSEEESTDQDDNNSDQGVNDSDPEDNNPDAEGNDSDQEENNPNSSSDSIVTSIIEIITTIIE